MSSSCLVNGVTSTTYRPRRNRQQCKTINATASELGLTDVSTAVRSEYRRIFTDRRDDLIAVSFNALLVTICWFLLPDSVRNWLFTLHGALAFPYVLQMWMLGDTPATNVAGRDAVRAVTQLHDPAALRV
jgi:hypothetical protein